MYRLNNDEIKRLTDALRAAFAIPFIDDIEDFIWERIFAYVRGIPLPDPLFEIRRKRLFDIVDPEQQIGWSAKALQWTVKPNQTFELVIQRADIFKKYADLGFPELSRDSAPQILGRALLEHWYRKIDDDSEAQNVRQKRVCILLKSRDRRRFAYYEGDLNRYTADSLEWKWTNTTKTGLQGLRYTDGFCVFRWYPNQKQLFERFILPDDAYIFDLEPQRLHLQEVVTLLLTALDSP